MKAGDISLRRHKHGEVKRGDESSEHPSHDRRERIHWPQHDPAGAYPAIRARHPHDAAGNPHGRV
ncbi:hypothetical protein [Herbaspirillum frisingense]|uniref:hypothetical protein n=1 Tax=Herbaspirillum frisingense TaxID=92645 RepID=UPI0035B54C48